MHSRSDLQSQKWAADEVVMGNHASVRLSISLLGRGDRGPDGFVSAILAGPFFEGVFRQQSP
ncbi:hypothetical protein AB1L42_23520 [Thalassoglobus sp. JC818]|uniref:hypothetical protein n=1 Tax=Thalassoglobus sp. JC818 TaxID=3232136 RepID=UPI00345926FE